MDDWPETPRARRRDSGMDLSYITERILALWFPGEVTAAEYRAGHQQTAHMLQSKHGSGYMVSSLEYAMVELTDSDLTTRLCRCST